MFGNSSCLTDAVVKLMLNCLGFPLVNRKKTHLNLSPSASSAVLVPSHLIPLNLKLIVFRLTEGRLCWRMVHLYSQWISVTVFWSSQKKRKRPAVSQSCTYRLKYSTWNSSKKKKKILGSDLQDKQEGDMTLEDTVDFVVNLNWCVLEKIVVHV